MTALTRGDPAALPSGTITFAFTDIEGSTERWDRDRSAMEMALRRHDALMRTAIAAHRGHVFKTMGDAFCAVFSKPEDAVAAMFDAQRALAAEDFSAVDGLRVRAALHTGTADERDNDYYGPSVNRVARLLGITYGGQVLLSGVTSDLVGDSLPPEALLRDLGEHRLKDLARPEHVYQLVGPGLVAEFPPLKSLGRLPNNLPPQLKSFVGRDAEIAEITALVGKTRIVTLVGSGGIGKTRTSLHVAVNLLDGSGDGVWLIELAPLSNGDYIPSTIAQTMGVSLAAEGDPVTNLVSGLKSKHALLIFDNCEHLVEATAHVIASVVRGCPSIKVLASSRQALGIEGEIAYRMPSLGVPNEAEASRLTARDAMRYPSILLFVDRARASDARFGLTDENAPIVADVCRRLDGIALAIELAAARAKILSPRQLRDRLNERFRVLAGGNRDVLPRHQTLRALIDWSHELLDARERALFRRVGIFVNGFGIEGAVAVGGGDEYEVMEVLASLVDKSLVLAEPGGDTVRYHLLESTRAYAAEKLAQAGERETIAELHLRYFRDRFSQIHENLERSRRPVEKNRAFEAELDNLRGALDWALASSDVRMGAELLAAIERAWDPCGLPREGIARVGSFLAALPDDEALLRGQLGGIMSALFSTIGNYGLAREAARRAVGRARASGDGPALAFDLLVYSLAHAMFGDYDSAEIAFSEAAAIPGLSPRLRASVLEQRAWLSKVTGDLDAAARAFEQLRDEARALGHTRGANIDTANLADIEHRRGNTVRAIAIFYEMLPNARNESDKLFLSQVLFSLATALTATGNLAGAREAAHECIGALSLGDADHFLIPLIIETLALVFALDQDLHRAAKLSGYADAAFSPMAYERYFAAQAGYDRLSALLREKLSAGDLSRLTAEGAALSRDAAIALALGATAS